MDAGLSAEDMFSLGMAYLLGNRAVDCMRIAQRLVDRNEANGFTFAILAAAYAELGLTNEAATAAARTREAMPFFDSGKFGTLIRNPTMRDNLLLHLKAAGL